MACSLCATKHPAGKSGKPAARQGHSAQLYFAQHRLEITDRRVLGWFRPAGAEKQINYRELYNDLDLLQVGWHVG